MKHTDIAQFSESAARLRRPEFLSVTGVDRGCSVARMRELSKAFPLEWGVLLGPRHQGRVARYPNRRVLERLTLTGLRFAAHLSGDHRRDVNLGLEPRLPVELGYFRRAIVFGPAPNVGRIAAYAAGEGVAPVAQTTGDFPADPRVAWLFDATGGRGPRPDAFPRHPGDGRLVGYRGGITLLNVLDVMAEIAATGPYWLDVEAGVKRGAFMDLDKIEALARTIWGPR